MASQEEQKKKIRMFKNAHFTTRNTTTQTDYTLILQ